MSGETQIGLDNPPPGGGVRPALENVTVADAAGNETGADAAETIAARHGGQPAESGADIAKRRERIRKWKSRHPGQTHPEEHLLPAGRPAVSSRPVVRKEPPAIPSMAAAAPSAAGPEGAAAAVPVAGEDDLEAVAILDWTPDEVAEITDELISGLESWDKMSDVKRARLANLAPALIAQIEADATMPKITKKILLKYLPKFLARKLNEAKVNPVKSDGALLTLGLCIYGWDKFSRHRFIAKEAKLSGGTVTAPKTK